MCMQGLRIAQQCWWKIQVFFNMTHLNCWVCTSVLKELTSYIFRTVLWFLDFPKMEVALSRLNTYRKASQKHNCICNIQDVSLYTNVSANYMFRPLLVRPSSGWIPSPRKYTIVLYNHWSRGGGWDLVYKNGARTQAIGIKYCIVYISLSIISRLVGVLGGSGFLHCLVGWLSVTAVRCYGRVFFLRCIWWSLQVYCCGGGVRLWCWYVRRASGFRGVIGMSLTERKAMVKHVWEGDICIYTNILYITNTVVFLTAFSIRVSLLSSKIHNGDDTPKDGSGRLFHTVGYCINLCGNMSQKTWIFIRV